MEIYCSRWAWGTRAAGTGSSGESMLEFHVLAWRGLLSSHSRGRAPAKFACRLAATHVDRLDRLRDVNIAGSRCAYRQQGRVLGHGWQREEGEEAERRRRKLCKEEALRSFEEGSRGYWGSAQARRQQQASYRGQIHLHAQHPMLYYTPSPLEETMRTHTIQSERFLAERSTIGAMRR